MPKYFIISKNRNNSSNFHGNSRENVFNNEICEELSLKLDGIDHNLLVYVDYDTFNSIGN